MIDLKCGDCLELMKTIPDKSIDMILSDSPYQLTRCKWDIIIPFEPLWEQYKRIIKDSSAIVLFGSEPFSSQLRLSNIKWYKYDWIWKKNKATQYLNAKKMPLNDYENILVFYKKLPLYNPQMTKGKRYSNNHKPNDSGECYGKVGYSKVVNRETRYPKRAINFNVDIKAEFHTTQKPVALLECLIKTYTNEGETVLDNCAGSMSTVIACINTNRNCIAYEKDEEIFNAGKERVEKHIESKNEVINDDKTI